MRDWRRHRIGNISGCRYKSPNRIIGLHSYKILWKRVFQNDRQYLISAILSHEMSINGRFFTGMKESVHLCADAHDFIHTVAIESISYKAEKDKLTIHFCDTLMSLSLFRQKTLCYCEDFSTKRN